MTTCSRNLAFGIAALVLLAAILYSRSVRDAYLLPDLQFIPKENAVLLATGDIRSLWIAVADHFGDAIERDEDREQGLLSPWFRDAKEELLARDLSIDKVSDLGRYGIDVDQGLLFSLNRLSTDAAGLLALGVTNQESFLHFVATLTDLEPEPEGASAREPEDRWSRVVTFDEDLLVAFPAAAETAVLASANNPGHLQRVLGAGRSNLAYARNDDPLHRSLRHLLQRPLGAGAQAYLLYRPRNLPGVTEIAGVLKLTDAEIRLEMTVQVPRDQLNLAERFFQSNAADDPWARYLHPKSAAVLVFEDRALLGRLHLIATSDDLATWLEEPYGGVFAELGKVADLRRVVIAMTGYREGLPELVMGIWGDPDDLADLVNTLTVRHQVDRDRLVLEGACQAYQQAHGARPETLDALRQTDLLAAEDGLCLSCYVLDEAGLVALRPGLSGVDPVDHVRRYRQSTLQYLLPGFTDNDLRYVPEFATLNAAKVRSHRYRLATFRHADMLWIASDARELEALVDRVTTEADAELPPGIVHAAQSQWDRHSKLLSLLDIDALIALGLLSPDTETEDWVRQILLDLQNHVALSAQVRTAAAEDRIVVILRLRRRGALETPP